MAILINMDMPQNCFQCPMARGDGETATWQLTASSTNSKAKRLDDCPILYGNVKIMPPGSEPLQGYGFSKRSCGACSHEGLPQVCKYCESYQGVRW